MSTADTATSAAPSNDHQDTPRPTVESVPNTSTSASTPTSHPHPHPHPHPYPHPHPSQPDSGRSDNSNSDEDSDDDLQDTEHEANPDQDSSDDESSGVQIGIAPVPCLSPESSHPTLTASPVDYSADPMVTLTQLINQDPHTSHCYQEFNPADEPWIRQQLFTAYEAHISSSMWVKLQSWSVGHNVMVVPRGYGRSVAIDLMNSMLSHGLNGRITAKHVHRTKGTLVQPDDMDMISLHQLIQSDPLVSAAYTRLSPSVAQHEKLVRAFLTYAQRQPGSHVAYMADGSLRLIKSSAKTCALHVIERLRQQAVRAAQIQLYSLEHAPPPPRPSRHPAESNDMKHLEQHLSAVERDFEAAYVAASTTLHRLTQPAIAELQSDADVDVAQEGDNTDPAGAPV